MRGGQHRGLGPQRGENIKWLNPPKVAFRRYRSSAKDGLSLWNLCEANDSFLLGEQPQKVPGIKKNGAKPPGFASADAYVCICMCARR